MKYKVNIYPHAHVANTKLYAYVTYAGTRLRFQVARVDAESEDKWSSETHRCVPKTRHGLQKIHASVINAEIDKFVNVVDSFFVLHATDKEAPSAEELKRFVNSRMKVNTEPTEAVSIYDDYEQFIRVQSINMGWSVSTVQKHKTLISDLKAEFPRLKYSQINSGFYSKFVTYLNKKGNRTGTVKKKLSHFEWFLTWAQNNGRAPRIKVDADEEVKLKEIKRPVIFLSWKELMKVWNLDLSNVPHLDRARDLFCFQCFTGLRYSDMAKLKKVQIYDDGIHVATEKTADALKIDLNDYSRELLDKYKEFLPDPVTLHHIPREGVEHYDLALPVISSQKYNKYIKEIMKKAEINTPVYMPYYVGNTRKEKTVEKHEVITSHAGRRTFICTALTLGIPVTTVMKWTGHKSFDAMKPYIDASEQARKDAMSLFNKH